MQLKGRNKNWGRLEKRKIFKFCHKRFCVLCEILNREKYALILIFSVLGTNIKLQYLFLFKGRRTLKKDIDIDGPVSWNWVSVHWNVFYFTHIKKLRNKNLTALSTKTWIWTLRITIIMSIVLLIPTFIIYLFQINTGPEPVSLATKSF